MNRQSSKIKSPVYLAQRMLILRAKAQHAPDLLPVLSRAEQRFASLPLPVQTAALAALELQRLQSRAKRIQRDAEWTPDPARGRPTKHAQRTHAARARRAVRRAHVLAELAERMDAVRAPFAPGALEALLAEAEAPRVARPALTQAALAGRYDFDPAHGVLYRTTTRGLRNPVSPRTTTVMVDRWRYPVLHVIGVLLGIAEPLQLLDPTQPPTVSNLLRKPPQ
jgi:hypothetical protein